MEEAFGRITKMQDEIANLSKQLAQSQRNQYDIEVQLMAKSQKLHDRDLEVESLNTKVD